MQTGHIHQKHRKIIWQISFLSLVLVILFINTTSTKAIPMPHGIDGIIYELDGLTEVAAGTSFSINDTESNYYVEGKTGRGSKGRYSAAITGEDGDFVEIRVWNEFHSSNRTITLEGIMHNVNLFLDTTIPRLPPIITSTPGLNAAEDELYGYNVEATDPNNDLLSYYLVYGPDSMIMDQTTGMLTWVPGQIDVGYHTIGIMVTDGTYEVNQTFTLLVQNINDAPMFNSTPQTITYVSLLYIYEPAVFDEDNDSLKFLLVTGPSTMIVNQTTGVVSWVPAANDVGLHQVTISVSDGVVNVNQSFIVQVLPNNNSNKSLFSIISSPVLNATVGKLYFYNVLANGTGPILYYLAQKPENMTISLHNGAIKWIPTNEYIGATPKSHVVVTAKNKQNYSATQEFTINVRRNSAPRIVSNPMANVSARTYYIYDVDAVDDDNETLAYRLIERPSASMTISKNAGLIRWRPDKKDIGTHNITVLVSDGTDSAIQRFSIEVLEESDTNHYKSSEKYIFSTTQNGVTFIDKVNISIAEFKINTGNTSQTFRVQVQDIYERVDLLKPLGRRLYRYLEITPNLTNEAKIKEALIQFKISKSWLRTYKVNISDVGLYRYHGDVWQTIPAKYVKEDSSFAYFEAEVPGFSYFAIGSLSAPVYDEMVIEEFPETIRNVKAISGTVFEFNGIRQVKANTNITVTNLNSDKVYRTQTGEGPFGGAFSLIINAKKGDVIKISLDREGTLAYKTVINGDINSIKLRKNIFGKLAVFEQSTLFFILFYLKPAMLVFAGIVAIFMIYRKFGRTKGHEGD